VIGVLSGFAIIGSIIALGYVIERTGLIGEGALHPLSRLIYFVASPALLFTVMADADLGVLFSPGVAVTVITIAAGIVVYLAISLTLLRNSVPNTVVGVLAAVQANAGNIGLPVAAYVLGNAQIVAPVMLVQVLVLTPVCLVIMDLSTQAKIRLGTIAMQPFRNPAIIAALAGLAVGLTDFELPAEIMQPFELVGGACVPLFLITFGMALRGQRIFTAGSTGREVAVATAIKIVLMPVVAFVLGRYAFGLDDAELFPVLVVAALPTAQNVYNIAIRFGRGETMSISTIMITTVLSVPVLLLAAAVLHP
jgi:malonate transporter